MKKTLIDFRKFSSLQQRIKNDLDYRAIENNKHLKKYLITDSEIVLNDFIKLKSINDITPLNI